jgi:hypothetical protein
MSGGTRRLQGVSPEAMSDLYRLAEMVGRETVLELLHREAMRRSRDHGRLLRLGLRASSPEMAELRRQAEALIEAEQLLSVRRR